MLLLHDRTGRLETRFQEFSLLHELHDRTGRLESTHQRVNCHHNLHDRTGRLERYAKTSQRVA